MDNKELNIALKKLAKQHGMCEKVRKQWDKDWDLDTMISQFYRNIDFFLKERYIPKNFFNELFEKEWLRNNAVLVDDKYSLLNPKYAILIGASDSKIRYNGKSVSTLYITDSSEAEVTAKGESFVMVHMMDSARINAHQFDKAKIVIIKHSTSCRATSDDDVVIRYELDYLS